MASRVSSRKSGILVFRENSGLMIKAKTVTTVNPKVVPDSRRVIFSWNSFKAVNKVVPKAAGIAKIKIVDSRAINSKLV